MSDWISVKDKLPPLNVPVLAGNKDGYSEYIYTPVLINGEFVNVFAVHCRALNSREFYVNCDFDWETICQESITHWQLLPKPPKGD